MEIIKITKNKEQYLDLLLLPDEQKDGHTMLIGTGNSPNTITFYEKRGFVKSHIIKNFFL